MYIGSQPSYQAAGIRPRDEITTDGTQICFPLSQSVPGSFESNVTVVLDNVLQQPVEAFTVVDTRTLTLTSISGLFLLNETVTGASSTATGTVIKVNVGSVVIRQLTGTFSSSELITGAVSSVTATTTNVTNNSGSGILFSEIPVSGSLIYIVHEGESTYSMIPAAASVTPTQLSDNLRNFTVDTFTGNGSTTAFTLSDTPASANSILVMVDGIVQTRTTNYTLSGNVVTFTGAPDSTAAVTVIHLGFSTISRTGLVDGSVTPVKLSSGAPIWNTSGNLIFPLTGSRITGDFSNATIANRVAFQTSTVNGNTVVGLLTNGTGTTSALQVSNASDITAALAFGNLQASSTEVAIQSGIRNAGTYLPMTFYTGGGERIRIDTSGNVGIGTSSPDFALDITGSIGINTATANHLTFHNGSGVTYAGIRANTNSNLIFATGNDLVNGERARIDSSGTLILNQGQIQFPSTQVASSNANTLDDYEEGTWTPNVANNGYSSTWTVKIGRYTKVGQLVTCWFNVDGGNSGTTGGALILTGLPFSDIGNGNWNVLGFVTTGGNNVPSEPIMMQGSGGTAAQIWLNGGAQDLGQKTYVSGMFTYRA